MDTILDAPSALLPLTGISEKGFLIIWSPTFLWLPTRGHHQRAWPLASPRTMYIYILLKAVAYRSDFLIA